MKNNSFYQKMVKDCKENNLLEPIFIPYIEWISNITPTIKCGISEAHQMVETASIRQREIIEKHPRAFEQMPTVIDGEAWEHLDGLGEDMNLYAYYQIIEYEVSNLIIMGYFN